MRAIIFGILAQVAYALGVFIMSRKLSAVNPFLLNFLIAGFGAILLLPVLWFTQSRPIFHDIRLQLLGWIALGAFFWITLAETFYVFGVQAAHKAGDLRPFALTALFFPVILAILEHKRNPLDQRFIFGFLVMAIGFTIIATRQR